MIKHECWPPPENWTEVTIMWADMLDNPDLHPRSIMAWLDAVPGGLYHLHGYRSTEGFAFRFKDAKDAMLFRLKWS
jgi:hypothetical protein